MQAQATHGRQDVQSVGGSIGAMAGGCLAEAAQCKEAQTTVTAHAHGHNNWPQPHLLAGAALLGDGERRERRKKLELCGVAIVLARSGHHDLLIRIHGAMWCEQTLELLHVTVHSARAAAAQKGGVSIATNDATWSPNCAETPTWTTVE